MAKLLRSPKTVTGLIALVAIFLLGIAGGALGNEFGGGFIGAPLAHIQLPAESISASPIVGDFNVTNTMVATWVAVIFLALISYVSTRRIQEVPGRLQCLVEAILEFFLRLAESVAGPEKARKFFPLTMTIFLFVVTANWMGILPGFGTIGWVEPAEQVIHHAEDKAETTEAHLDLSSVHLQVFNEIGPLSIQPLGSVASDVTNAEELETIGIKDGQRAGLLVPYLRSANTDINMTLSIAIIAMVMVHWWGLRMLGATKHIGKFINFKEGVIGLFVGLLEAVSEVARIISFTFRLFGNIFAGEVLLIAMAFLLPLIGLVPFLGLELFVGLIQAFIFSMLTLVFASTATVSHETEDH